MERQRRRRVTSYNAPDFADYNAQEGDEAIRAALEVLAKRAAGRVRDDGQPIKDPGAAGRYCQLMLASQNDRERFGVMFLDTRHRMIAWEVLFMGTIDGSEVQPREVAKRALFHNAAAVIVSHNHPSDNPEPSAADRAVTTRLKQALQLLDVRLLDHFVVTATNPPTSMAARGWV